MGLDFKWNRTINDIIAEKVANYKTLMFMASAWHRLYDEFTPMDTGNLAHDSVDTYVDGNSGIIHHKAPYAAAMYYGGGLTFSREKHPLASAHWDEAAKSAGKKEDLARDVQEFIKKGGGS